jgi:hypothetical protein
VSELYLVKGFIRKKKSAVLGDLSIIKSKLQPVCDGFLGIPAGWESYVTPRQPIGVRWGGWGSHREFPQLPIGRLGVMFDSKLHSYTLFYSHLD